MNVPNSPLTKGEPAPANPRSQVPGPGDSPSRQFQQLAQDAQKLVTVMEQNRARINQGWEELARLDRVLASLQAKLGTPAKVLHKIEPEPLRKPDSSDSIPRAA